MISQIKKCIFYTWVFALFILASPCRGSQKEQSITYVFDLLQQVTAIDSLEERDAYLSSLLHVKTFFEIHPEIAKRVHYLPLQEAYAVKALIALGQGPIVFEGWDVNNVKALNHLASVLSTTESFYKQMGGIIGYHAITMQLIDDAKNCRGEQDSSKIDPPPYIDVRKPSLSLTDFVNSGLHAMETASEIYAVGGAGDRLGLIDEKTKEPLPVAKLDFCGRTLLEGMIRDLEAREYLYYQLTGKQVRTPIVLMTSKEKRNDEQISAIFKERNWFGRPQESVYFMLQPLVPVLTVEGTWAVHGPCDLVLKPGGHGVLWKLAKDSGALDWLQKQNKRFCLVRQINNPVAGLDHGLLSLAGYGYTKQKAFGFASCPRIKNMSEGMNILRTTQKGGKIEGSISNIEYTEFAKRKGSDPYFARIADLGDFPANTNILYANISAVAQAVTKLPIPGLLVNMKHPVETMQHGEKRSLLGARLESTMQNIADVLTETFPEPMTKEKLESLPTFILLNERSKTISVTKKSYDGASSIAETPEGCFYDLIKENRRLLKEECGFIACEMNSPEEYTKEGPSTLFLYHPALGPLYSIISQKLSKGTLARGAEMQIEAASVSITNLNLDGSLLISAKNITGVINPTTKLLEFSPAVGRCLLENVSIKNKGIDRTAKNVYWKNMIKRHESLQIILEGDSEFVAKNVTFSGNRVIRVLDGQRVTATNKADGSVVLLVERLQGP